MNDYMVTSKQKACPAFSDNIAIQMQGHCRIHTPLKLLFYLITLRDNPTDLSSKKEWETEDERTPLSCEQTGGVQIRVGEEHVIEWIWNIL